MKKRIITGIVLGVILLPALFGSAFLPELKKVMEIIILFALVGGTLELLFMYDKSKRVPTGVKVVTVLLTILMYVSMINWFYQDFSSIFGSCPVIVNLVEFIHATRVLNPVTASLVIFVVLMSLLIFLPGFEASDVGKLYIAIMYLGLCAAAFNILYTIGLRLVVYLLFVTITTDIFALVFGMLFGKHKMAPNISPKKTWEGAIGGTVSAVIVGGLILFLYSKISPIFHDGHEVEFFDGIFQYSNFTLHGKIIAITLLSLLLSVCGQIGDLVASKLKRTYGIKDYSQIFPGHGGVLDRFDSAFFASAIFLLYILIQVCINM